MSGLSETEVKQEVKTILEGADLSTLSERKIRELLAEKFGDAVYTNPTKLLIAVSTSDILTSLGITPDQLTLQRRWSVSLAVSVKVSLRSWPDGPLGLDRR